VIKTDSTGNQTWRRTYGGAEKDGGYGVALTADGSILVAGYSRSYGGTIQDPTQPFQWADAMLMKLSPTGDTTWHKIKGLRPRGAEFINAISVTADGGFVIAGSSGGNVLLAKFDKNGDTANLGASDDLTINLPTTLGVISFSNAVDVAGLGANGLILPREVGGALLDLLLATSVGGVPPAFCTAGGSYSFNPVVPATLVAGVSYTLTFTNCMAGSSADAIRINGSGVLTVDSVSGAPSSGTYALQMTATSIALTVDEPGAMPLLSQNFVGGLRIARTATGGNFAETATAPLGVTLNVAESSGGTVLRTAAYGPFSVRYTISTSGDVSIGQAGDSATVTSGSNSFTIGVMTAISVPASGQPPAGVYRVTAQDNSRLTATLSISGTDSSAALAIDTNGDGTDDGTIAVPWDFIY
jgi:hypothetical protein